MLKPLTVWITTNGGKFLKRWECQTTLPVSSETCMWGKKQPLEPNMEQWTGFKLGKEYDKAVYCHPAYLTYMQNTSCNVLGWINLKLESIKIEGRKISFRYAENTTLMAGSKQELKSLLMRVKEKSEKTDLKLNIQKTEIMASGSITLW